MNNVGGMAVESKNVFDLEVKPHFTSRVRLQYSDYKTRFRALSLSITKIMLRCTVSKHKKIFILCFLKVLQMRNNYTNILTSGV